MAIYEVTYSTKAASNEKLSFSDVVLVESETPEVFIDKVVDLICTLGPPGSHYVDSIGGNPYEPAGAYQAGRRELAQASQDRRHRSLLSAPRRPQRADRRRGRSG